MTRWPSIALLSAAILLITLLLVLLVRSLTQHPEGFRSTALMMQQIADSEDLWANRWRRHEDKANALQAQLDNTSRESDRIDLRRRIAEQFLFAGSPQAAIAELQQLLRDHGDALPATYRTHLVTVLAVSYLRLGELQNCVWNPNSDRCVFPIQGAGVHVWRSGAEQATQVLLDALNSAWLPAAEQDGMAWLLNIAFMALGEYPQAVPARWRLAPELLDSDADIGRFVNIAQSAGVAEFGLSGGAIVDDFNGDDLPDIMASSWGYRDPLAYFENLGSLQFQDRRQTAGLDQVTGGLNLVHADYDNDGDNDILVLRGAWLHRNGQHPNTLLRNDGGRFTDVTWSAGLTHMLPTQTAVWADFDNDGWLDLFIGNEILESQLNWPADTPAFELYRNQQDDGFKAVMDGSGIELNGMIKGCAAGDFDNDGWMDLYVSVWGGPNRLLHNLGGQGEPWRFQDVAHVAGVTEPLASFPTWFWDFDNDGWLDLFVAGYRGSISDVARDVTGKSKNDGARSRLYRNLGNGRFADVTTRARLDHLLLAMGSNFGDLDNDGWPDILIGTGAPPFEMLVPNRAFRNVGGRRFDDITTSGGFGHLQKGHGVAFGDLDGDGDQDIYATIGGAYESDRFWNALYENPGHGNDWIGLNLQGVKANRGGLGSRLRISLASGRQIHALIGSGGSFGGSSIQPTVGLGADAVIREIEVTWSGSGTRDLITGPVPVNRRYRLSEGSNLLSPLQQQQD